MAGIKFKDLAATTDINNLLGVAENADGVTSGNKFTYSNDATLGGITPSNAVVSTQAALSTKFATKQDTLLVSANSFVANNTGSASSPAYLSVSDSKTLLGAGAANGLATLDSLSKVPIIQLPEAVLGAISYQGTWDASGGIAPTPTTKGYYWVVSVAGTIGVIQYGVGDWIIYNTEGVIAKVDNTDTWMLSAGDLYTLGGAKNVNLSTAGLKDTNVTTAVKLGDVTNTSLNTTNKTLLGGQNELYALNANKNSGVLVYPPLTNNLDGTVTIGSGITANFYTSNDITTAQLVRVTSASAATLSLADGATNVVYAYYNSGDPAYAVTTNPLSLLANATYIPMYRIIREGNILHTFDFSNYGFALAGKSYFKDIFLNSFERQSGLVLTTAATRTSDISAGSAWFGVRLSTLVQNQVGTYGNLYQYYLASGSWLSSLVTEYDSTYYSDGTNRQTLSSNRYVSKYFFRAVDTGNDAYYIHGNQYNTAADAINEVLPVVPTAISSHSLYVGKIVIQQGATNGTAYPRVWEGSVASAGVTNHEDLSNILQAASGITNGHISDQAQIISGDKTFTGMAQRLQDTITNMPHGFENKTDSTISYNPTTRVFTISPTSTNFKVWVSGNRYTFSAPVVLAAHAATAGSLYYVYVDNLGVFNISSSLPSFFTNAYCSIIYYYSATQYIVLEERHGCLIDAATHMELHRQIGTYYVSGLAASGYLISPTTPTNAGNQFATASGVIADEDLESSISAVAAAGPYSVMQLTGSTALWLYTSQTLPFNTSATYIQYNQFTGGAWQLTTLANNNYVNYYVCFVPSLNAATQMVVVPGQAVYTSLATAQGESFANLSLSTLPFAEILPLYQVTFRTSTTYTNTGKCRIESFSRIVGSKTTILNNIASNHNALTGLESAATGVTWGHISDQVQAIAGDKTLSGSTTLSGSLTISSLTASTLLALDANKNAVSQTIVAAIDTSSNIPTSNAVKSYVDGQAFSGYWNRTGTDLTPKTAGDNVNLGTGGLKDANVTTAIKLGDATNTSLATLNQTIVGGINNLQNLKFDKAGGDISGATTISGSSFEVSQNTRIAGDAYGGRGTKCFSACGTTITQNAASTKYITLGGNGLTTAGDGSTIIADQTLRSISVSFTNQFVTYFASGHYMKGSPLNIQSESTTSAPLILRSLGTTEANSVTLSAATQAAARTYTLPTVTSNVNLLHSGYSTASQSISGIVGIGGSAVASTTLAVTGPSSGITLLVNGFGAGLAWGMQMTPLNDTIGISYIRFNNAAGVQIGAIYDRQFAGTLTYQGDELNVREITGYDGTNSVKIGVDKGVWIGSQYTPTSNVATTGFPVIPAVWTTTNLGRVVLDFYKAWTTTSGTITFLSMPTLANRTYLINVWAVSGGNVTGGEKGGGGSVTAYAFRRGGGNLVVSGHQVNYSYFFGSNIDIYASGNDLVFGVSLAPTQTIVYYKVEIFACENYV